MELLGLAGSKRSGLKCQFIKIPPAQELYLSAKKKLFLLSPAVDWKSQYPRIIERFFSLAPGSSEALTLSVCLSVHTGV